MLRTLLSLTCLLPLTFGAELVSRERNAKVLPDGAQQAVAQPQSSDREGKFFSIFQVVKFENGQCSSSDGNHGVCFTEAECSAKGGIATGSCASNYGVCCIFKANVCGSTVSQKITYIESPNYPNPSPTGMCMYNIGKVDGMVCQYKVQFEDVMLAGPEMGDCTNDTLLISNVDPVSAAVVPTNLCGTLSGQEMYLTVNDTTTDPKFTFNIASSDAKYRIKVTQLHCTDTESLAPPGCLTYSTDVSGNVCSFNNQNGNGELLNNQMFSHCIKYQTGFGDIAFTSSDFDLGAGDSITIGSQSQTGATFGTGGNLMYNFTGPYVFPSLSDGDNTAMNSGYCLSYLLLPI